MSDDKLQQHVYGNRATRQLDALSRIRKLIEEYFPAFYFCEEDFTSQIETEEYERIGYNEQKRQYEIEAPAHCKVCSKVDDPIFPVFVEVPTKSGNKFHICRECLKKVSSKQEEKAK